MSEQMKPLLFLFLAAVAIVHAADHDSGSPAGAYRYGGDTQVISLALLPNGNYLAHWSLDIFPDNGSASGSWHVEGDTVHLIPKKEEGALRGHLRVLLIRTIEGRRALLRKDDAQHEKNPFFYFYRKEPNKSLPSTAPSRRG
jgi:hypothetical protein